MKPHPEDLVRVAKCTELLAVAYDLTVKASFLTLDVETENLVNSAFLALRIAARSANESRNAIAKELEERDSGELRMSINDNDAQFIYALHDGFKPHFDVYHSLSAAQKAVERRFAGVVTFEEFKISNSWLVHGKNPKTPDTEESYCIVKKPILG